MHTPSPNPNLEVTQDSSSAYDARDGTDHQFFIRSTLSGGVLRFTVVAEIPNGQRGNVSGREFFEAMMAHFGSRVTKIEAHWIAGIDLETNIQQFNDLAGPKNNLSDSDAANGTWTGQRALNHGFTNVRVIFKDPPNTPGAYTEVMAEFTKP